MTAILAYTALAILALLALFQLALLAGAPLGKFAWGGAHTVLPRKLRIGSGISIILYGIFAVIISSRAGVIGNTIVANVGIWVLAGYFLLGVLMNAISRSKYERAVMTPVAFVLSIACLLIAIR